MHFSHYLCGFYERLAPTGLTCFMCVSYNHSSVLEGLVVLQ